MNRGSRKRAKEIARALVELLAEQGEREHRALFEATLHFMQQHGLMREMRHLPQLLKEAMYEREGSISAIVSTPSGKLGEEGAALNTELEKAISKQVMLEERSLPSLLGGAILAIGDERLDGSLRGALMKLRATLAETSPLAASFPKPQP